MVARTAGHRGVRGHRPPRRGRRMGRARAHGAVLARTRPRHRTPAPSRRQAHRVPPARRRRPIPTRAVPAPDRCPETPPPRPPRHPRGGNGLTATAAADHLTAAGSSRPPDRRQRQRRDRAPTARPSVPDIVTPTGGRSAGSVRSAAGTLNRIPQCGQVTAAETPSWGWSTPSRIRHLYSPVLPIILGSLLSASGTAHTSGGPGTRLHAADRRRVVSPWPPRA